MNISGKIYADENELSFADLSYSVYVTRTNEYFKFTGTCWFDPSLSVPFAFDYDMRKDTVIYKGPVRQYFCSYELYNKYYLNLQYKPNINNHFLCVPWIKIQTAEVGVAVPQLIESILSRVPNVILFQI